MVQAVSKDMELERALDRLNRIFNQFGLSSLRYGQIETEFVVLYQSLEDDVRLQLFYRYPKDKAIVLTNVPNDWHLTLQRFPSARGHIEAGVDCYALGHSTACVFHLMLVAEQGLRALARERKIKKIKKGPMEWAEWIDIIKDIRADVEKMATGGLPKGPKRDASLEFYRGSLGEFEAFKDAYRNKVMHGRAIYDESKALSVINHVRGFMERLSEHIDESGKRIKRK